MTHSNPRLPPLAVHRGFIESMCEADGACCGLGLVEEHGHARGLIVLQPHETIPPEVSARGFELGHCVLGLDEFEVVQLTFQFVGFKTYHVLLNPSSTVVQRVLGTLLHSGEYFIFFIKGNRRVETFRSELGQENLDGLKANWARLSTSATTEAQYRRALAAFTRRPQPPGHVLEWVCGDEIEHLDIHTDHLDLRAD